jgi:formate dehydrogenase maturation protein FdhE
MDSDELAFNCGVVVYLNYVIFFRMSTVQEIEAAIPRLSRAEIEEVRAWIDHFLEDQFELTDEVKAKLDQSRHEIAEGRYTTRLPE